MMILWTSNFCENSWEMFKVFTSQTQPRINPSPLKSVVVCTYRKELHKEVLGDHPAASNRQHLILHKSRFLHIGGAHLGEQVAVKRNALRDAAGLQACEVDPPITTQVGLAGRTA